MICLHELFVRFPAKSTETPQNASLGCFFFHKLDFVQKQLYCGTRIPVRAVAHETPFRARWHTRVSPEMRLHAGRAAQ